MSLPSLTRRKEGRGQAMADNELFEKGLKTRKQVLGAEYVDANLAGSDDFMMTFQRAVTELAWGYAWSRPSLPEDTIYFDAWHPRRTRSLSRARNLYECGDCERRDRRRDQRSIRVDTVYCGTPAGRQAFLAAHEALKRLQKTDLVIDTRTSVLGTFAKCRLWPMSCG